jgi:hypothetical protein
MIKLLSGHLKVADGETNYQIVWENRSVNATIILQVQANGVASESIGRLLNFSELEGMHLARVIEGSHVRQSPFTIVLKDNCICQR